MLGFRRFARLNERLGGKKGEEWRHGCSFSSRASGFQKFNRTHPEIEVIRPTTFFATGKGTENSFLQRCYQSRTRWNAARLIADCGVPPDADCTRFLRKRSLHKKKKRRQSPIYTTSFARRAKVQQWERASGPLTLTCAWAHRTTSFLVSASLPFKHWMALSASCRQKKKG